MSTRTLASTLVALALFASAAAQTETPAQPAVTVDGAAPSEGTATRDRDTLSVDFPDEDIRTILRNVADLFELNLVIPDTLTGKTSIKLRDVTWRQIFQVVLSPAGYTYVEEGNIIKVVSNESLTMEPVATEVFILNNAKAGDILPTVSSLVDPAAGGKIVIDARSNALVVTERPTRMTRMRAIIEQLDKATAQVMIESRFVEVTDRDQRALGLDWTIGGGLQIGGVNDRVVRRTADRNDTTAVNYQRNIDRSVNPPVATVIGGDTQSITREIVRDVSRDISTAVLSDIEFSAVLRALENNGNTKVVSSPTVVTLNNTEAFLNVGEEFPIPSYTYNSERGTFEVSGFQYKPIGVILKVTPQVNAAGIIKLTLEPEVSQQNGETSFGGAGGATIPIIATRKARTQVSLKDGYTAGIGGLISSSQIKGENRVPVLGHLPGVGRLFRSTSNNDVRTNLLIFITARSVNAEGADPATVFSSTAMEATSSLRN